MWRTIRFGLAASVCAQFGQVNGGTHTTNRPEEIAKTYQVGFCILKFRFHQIREPKPY